MNIKYFGLLAFIVLGFMVANVSAGTTHINSTNLATVYLLNTANESYILDNDITAGTDAFRVYANGITFDGNNHTVTFAVNGTGKGVYSTSAYTGVTIKNVILTTSNTSASSTAVSLTSYIGLDLQNINASSIAGYGLYLDNDTSLVVSDCSGSSTSQNGLYGKLTTSNLTNCTGTSGSTYGMYLYQTNNSNFTGCIGTSSSSYGFYCRVTYDDNFVNCTGTGGSNIGFYVYQSARNVLTGCHGISTSSYGCYLYQSNNIIIDGCIGTSVSSNSLFVELTPDSIFRNSVFTASGSLVSSNGMYFKNNTNETVIACNGISNAGYALFYNNVTGSTCNNSSFYSRLYNAFTVFSTSDNNIFNNNTFNCDNLTGTAIYSSVGNVFTNNIVSSPLSSAPHSTNSILSMGDSITEGSTVGAGETVPYGAWSLPFNSSLNQNSNWYVSNMGKSGTTSITGRARFLQEMLIYHPQYVTLMYGKIDITNNVTQQDTIDNVLWMANQAKLQGAIPIIMLTPASQTDNDKIIYLNNNLSSQATTAGYNVVNMYDLLDSTPNNGQYDSFVQSSYVDGNHPNSVGNALIGTHLARNVFALNKTYYGTGLNNTIAADGSVLHSRDILTTDILTPLTITPSTGSITVNVSRWNTNGDYRKTWNESSETPSATTTHIMGYFPTNTLIGVWCDGSLYANPTSNNTGYITWTYSGGYSEHEFDVYPDLNSVTTTVSMKTPASTDNLKVISINSSSISSSSTSSLYGNLVSSISSGYILLSLGALVLGAYLIFRHLNWM